MIYHVHRWKNSYFDRQIAAPFSLEGLRYGWHIDPEPADDGEPLFEQPVLDPCARCLSSGGCVLSHVKIVVVCFHVLDFVGWCHMCHVLCLYTLY